MIFDHHKEEVIYKNIKKLKPLKYNKFYWWRRFSNNEQPITRRHSIKDKIKGGYYDFPASFWDLQLCALELNQSYSEYIKDYSIFLEKNGIVKSRYKRLLDDYHKEEQLKLQRIIEDFTNSYILKKEQVIEILENFQGNINDLYEFFERNYSYAYGKPSYKKTF